MSTQLMTKSAIKEDNIASKNNNIANVESSLNVSDKVNREALLKKYLQEREARKFKAEIQQRNLMHVHNQFQQTCHWLQNQQHAVTQAGDTTVSSHGITSPIEASGGKLETSCLYREAQNCVNEPWVPLSTVQTWHTKYGEFLLFIQKAQTD